MTSVLGWESLQCLRGLADARGIVCKNRLVYHPAKGTVTGRVVLTVQKGDRTQTIRAKAKGTLKDGVITGTLDAKGLGVLDFTVK